MSHSSLETPKFRVLYVKGNYEELHKRLGIELAHDVEMLKLLFCGLPPVLQMAEQMVDMGTDLRKYCKKQFSIDEDKKTQDTLLSKVKSEEGKSALLDIMKNMENTIKRLEDSKVSKGQWKLYKVCQGMNEKSATSKPTWAPDGVHVFVTPAVANHSNALQAALEDYRSNNGNSLGKGFIVVSEGYFGLLVSVLQEGKGKKPKVVEQKQPLSIGTIKIDDFRKGPSSLKTRETRSTGDMPNSHQNRDSRVWNGEVSQGTGAHKNFLLPAVDIGVRTEELFDVCSPGEVEKLTRIEEHVKYLMTQELRVECEAGNTLSEYYLIPFLESELARRLYHHYNNILNAEFAQWITEETVKRLEGCWAIAAVRCLDFPDPDCRKYKLSSGRQALIREWLKLNVPEIEAADAADGIYQAAEKGLHFMKSVDWGSIFELFHPKGMVSANSKDREEPFESSQIHLQAPPESEPPEWIYGSIA